MNSEVKQMLVTMFDAHSFHSANATDIMVLALHVFHTLHQPPKDPTTGHTVSYGALLKIVGEQLATLCHRVGDTGLRAGHVIKVINALVCKSGRRCVYATTQGNGRSETTIR